MNYSTFPSYTKQTKTDHSFHFYPSICPLYQTKGERFTWFTKHTSASRFFNALPSLGLYIPSQSWPDATVLARICWSLSIPCESASSACWHDCSRLVTSNRCWSKRSRCGTRTCNINHKLFSKWTRPSCFLMYSNEQIHKNVLNKYLQNKVLR